MEHLNEKQRERFFAIQALVKADPAYCAMLHQLREVEHAYDIVLGKLSAEDMNTVCDFVSLCEGINERMLAFACQKMVFSPEA